MANKAVLFLVVGILVGATAGAATGYIVWNSSNNEETYWFYIDYGSYETSTVQNGWISAKSDAPLSGFKKALYSNGIEYEINAVAGFVSAISGVAPDYGTDGESWGSWLWTADSYTSSIEAWQPTPGLDITIGSVFYIAVSTFDLVKHAPELNPDTKSDWKRGGPFAST